MAENIRVLVVDDSPVFCNFMKNEIGALDGIEIVGTAYNTAEAKEKILGVSHETLEKYGAVSPDTALQMAKGARVVSGSDIAVSVTGIA
ncbi:MAG: CinA family protein, partial [Ruminiclostridium sp.]|nr:CinA family protein [Ruminiclostridium sp.]